MKKTIVAIAGIILIFYGVLLYLNFSSTKMFLENTDSVTMKIAGDRNFPPYEYIGENGQYMGFNVDIMRAIALSTGINVQFYPMEWSETSEKLQENEIDVIQGIKMTKAREIKYDFSDAYLENSQSIFVDINSEVEELENLKFHKVAIQQGDVAIADLEALGTVDIILTKDQEEAMKKLVTGEVDAYIGNTLTGAFLMNQIGISNNIKIAGETLNPSKYAIAVNKGNANTLHILNNGLKEIKRNGTYDKIYRKWFGQPLQFPSWYKRRLIISGSIALSLLLIMIYFLYRWNTSLKREVQKQTREIQKANNILLNQNKEIGREKDFKEKILQNIFLGVITINQEGRISFANQLACFFLNTEDKLLLGVDYRDTFLWQLFSFDNFEEKKGQEEININGEKRFLDYDIRIISGIDKEVEEVILLFRDITEERKMQESIKTKDKLQSLGNLVAGIAHEIRNPLTAIKTYAEILPKKINNPEFQIMFSKDIPSEIDRINTLINDLLEYSKPRKPFREKIYLNSALEIVLILLNNKIKEARVEVKNNIPNHIYVEMDKNHLKQVFLNMLLNAIESMDKGKKEIVFSTEVQDENILLHIYDNGCGIDKDSMNKIFNPFFTTKSHGTGLGLFVCFQLLSENDVILSCDSTEEIGTVFTMTFNKWGDDWIGETVSC